MVIKVLLGGINLRWLRIASGLILGAIIFYASRLATKDCAVNAYFASNCLGLWAENHLALPHSRILRGLILEGVGILLVAGLFLDARYVFPHRGKSCMESPTSGRHSTADEFSDVGSIINTERLVLRALLQAQPGDPLRAEANSLLARYRWREPIHQEVFRAIFDFPADQPAALKDRLPARLTRRGFPDFDINSLFQSQDLSREQLTDLMKSLNRLN